MIVVTGTKRSGTSMWMQILKAAGFQIMGQAFMGDWEQTIREGNREGFYESLFRNGIHPGTNPHPITRVLLPAEGMRVVAVKVFVPGVIKTEPIYLDRVVATMRNWREYATSIKRFRALSRADRPTKKLLPESAFVPPALEWWNDNYTLIQDAKTRRYPLRLMSYASVLRNPNAMIGGTLRWLGAGDAAAAQAVVQPTMQTQFKPEEGNNDLTPGQNAIFDELYARVDEGSELDVAFVDCLRKINGELAPKIQAAYRDFAQWR